MCAEVHRARDREGGRARAAAGPSTSEGVRGVGVLLGHEALLLLEGDVLGPTGAAVRLLGGSTRLVRAAGTAELLDPWPAPPAKGGGREWRARARRTSEEMRCRLATLDGAEPARAVLHPVPERLKTYTPVCFHRVLARPSSCPPEPRRRAVRMVAEVLGDCPNESAALRAVAEKPGIGSAETIHGEGGGRHRRVWRAAS